jgi:hypothetical protein
VGDTGIESVAPGAGGYWVKVWLCGGFPFLGGDCAPLCEQ